jgi:hypothetical protein
VNKPITQAPVLMSCYIGHLNQLRCNDWSVPTPLPSRMKQDPSFYSLSSASQSLQYIHGPACVPHFMQVKQGFNVGVMREKEEMLATPSTPAGPGPSDPWSPVPDDQQYEGNYYTKAGGG